MLKIYHKYNSLYKYTLHKYPVDINYKSPQSSKCQHNKTIQSEIEDCQSLTSKFNKTATQRYWYCKYLANFKVM